MHTFINHTAIARILKTAKLTVLTLCLSIYSIPGSANEFFSLETIGCPVYPSKDIKIDNSYVTLTKDNQIWQIAKDGVVTLNGKIVQLTESGKESAKKYQKGLRNELPELYATTQNLIETNLTKLDGVIEKTLGKNSRLRETIKELKPVIQEEFASVINQESNGTLDLSLSHLKNINDRVNALAEQYSKPIIQDTLAEIATSQLFSKKEDKISLPKLQEELKSTFSGENEKAKALLDKACNAFKEWNALEADFINEKILKENSNIL